MNYVLSPVLQGLTHELPFLPFTSFSFAATDFAQVMFGKNKLMRFYRNIYEKSIGLKSLSKASAEYFAESIDTCICE